MIAEYHTNLNIRVSQDLRDKLEALSNKYNKTISEVVRVLLVNSVKPRKDNQNSEGTGAPK